MVVTKASRPAIVLPMRGPRETNQLGSVIGPEAISDGNKHQANLSIRPTAAGDEGERSCALQARRSRPDGHGQRTNFDTINRVALAAFPAVLARLLPGRKSVGPELIALSPRRSDAASGRSRSTATTGVGRIAQRRSDFACRISRQRFAGRSGALAGAHAPHRNGPARPAARPLKRPNAAV